MKLRSFNGFEINLRKQLKLFFNKQVNTFNR